MTAMQVFGYRGRKPASDFNNIVLHVLNSDFPAKPVKLFCTLWSLWYAIGCFLMLLNAIAYYDMLLNAIVYY